MATLEEINSPGNSRRNWSINYRRCNEIRIKIEENQENHTIYFYFDPPNVATKKIKKLTSNRQISNNHFLKLNSKVSNYNWLSM